MTHAGIALSEELSSEDMLHIEVTIRRSFDLHEIRQIDNRLEIIVGDNAPGSNLERTLKRVVRACRYASNDLLFVRSVASHDSVDPQPALEYRGDVQRFGSGLFAFTGDFLRVRTALDRKVIDIAALHDATELSYPSLWPVPVLQSINYFHDFPQLALLACGVEPNFQARDTFATRFSKASQQSTIACAAENGVGPAHNVLAPTVCDCCYWLLQGRRDVSDRVYTMHGQVFRNESSVDHRLDRLTAYTMREIVIVGSPAFVLSRREALIDNTSALITSLDLACEIKAADDPFFCNDALQKNMMQNLDRLKYEVDVPLFAGRHVAVASVNLHNDFFSRNYDFKCEGSELFSACVGFGYERLTYALFCRHGVDLAQWPTSVLAFLELRPKNLDVVEMSDKTRDLVTQ